MPDALKQQLMGRLGVRMPQAPPLSPEQEALRQEMIRRETTRPPHGIVENVHDFLGGLVGDPTQMHRSTAEGLGMMAGSLPFAPKGIKGMYSRVEKIAESLPESIHPNKLLSILKNRASGEEVQWRGLDKMLAGRNQPVKKAEVVGQLERKPLDVKVVEKGGNWPGTGPLDEAWDGLLESHYGNYQMPGASNYREALLQLPVSEELAKGTYDPTRQPNPIFQSHHWDEPNVLVHVRHNERHLPDAPLTPEQQGVYDELIAKNALGSAADLRAAQAPKGRMLENVQSDWHQRGAHHGYILEGDEGLTKVGGDPELQAAIDRNREDLERLSEQINALLPERVLVGDGEDPARIIGQRAWWEMTNHPDAPYVNAIEPLQRELANQQVIRDHLTDQLTRASGEAVPDAPFKDSWAELALKQQLLDIAHNRPDLEWLGIAPSSELRQRGEVISPEFQDVQLPRTLEKLVGQFGGKVEQAPIMEKGQPFLNPNTELYPSGSSSTLVQRFLTGDDPNPTPIASVWPRGSGNAYNPDKDAGQLMAAIQRNRPELFQPEYIEAFLARLTPEMLAQIREKGFPLLLAMLAAQEAQDARSSR